MPDSAAAPRSGSGAARGGRHAADPDGAAITAGLRRFGRRYPAVGRVGVSVLCAAAGPFAAPPQGVGFATAAALTVVAWNLLYLRILLPDGRPERLYRWTCVVPRSTA